MKAKITIFITFILLNASPILAQGLANDIKLDTLKKYLRELTGDTQAIIDGNTYTIATRNTNNKSSNYLAARYIKNRLQSYGLQVSEQPFTYNYGVAEGKNVYAVQTGTKYPNKKFIICAHFDNMPGTLVAPGADDNGSGTCTVLEAARVLSKYMPEYTIVYALWSGEEQGLIGSYYYAEQAFATNEDIVGVLNIDMIAYDIDNDNNVDIFYRNMGSKQSLMDAMLNRLADANQSYNLGMNIFIMPTASRNSDHYPFIEKGYPSFLMIEGGYKSNLNYHQTTDTYSSLNISFYEKCSKLAILSLAMLAGVPGSTVAVEYNKEEIPFDFVLNQNYPNPFNPSTVISYTLKSGGNVNLMVFDALGREVKTLVNEFQSAGLHQVNFSVENKNLTSGIYFYKLQSGSATQIKKMIYLK